MRAKVELQLSNRRDATKQSVSCNKAFAELQLKQAPIYNTEFQHITIQLLVPSLLHENDARSEVFTR